MFAFILLLPPGQVPEDPAGVHLESMTWRAVAHPEAGARTGCPREESNQTVS